MNWAVEHDDRAQQIAAAGSRKAQELLTSENVYCYYAKALELYRYFRSEKFYDCFSKKQNREPKLYDDYVHKKEDDDKGFQKAPCPCERSDHDEL